MMGPEELEEVFRGSRRVEPPRDIGGVATPRVHDKKASEGGWGFECYVPGAHVK